VADMKALRSSVAHMCADLVASAENILKKRGVEWRDLYATPWS